MKFKLEYVDQLGLDGLKPKSLVIEGTHQQIKAWFLARVRNPYRIGRSEFRLHRSKPLPLP